MAGDGWINIDIKGMSELEQSLKRLPDEIARKVLAQAVLAGAVVVRDEARRLCPRKTGRLAKSISARKKKNPGREATAVYQVGPKLFTGHMIEFGTAPHIIKAGKKKVLALRGNKRSSSGKANRWINEYADQVSHPGTSARPFLRPAFDNMTAQVIDKMRQRLALAIERGEIKMWRQQMGWM